MKTVIFDLDGTLLDTAEDLTDSVNYILRKYQYSAVDTKTVIRNTGNASRNLLKNCMMGEVEEETLDRMLQEYKAYYARHFCNKTKPYEGVAELLNWLKTNGYQIAVVSNKPMPIVKALCKTMFPGILAIGEEPGTPRKPSPNMVQKVMKQLKSTRDETIYVGDSEVDVLTAKNAQIPCVIVTWGFRSVEELRMAGATVIANSCEELKEKIKEVLV